LGKFRERSEVQDAAVAPLKQAWGRFNEIVNTFNISFTHTQNISIKGQKFKIGFQGNLLFCRKIVKITINGDHNTGPQSGEKNNTFSALENESSVCFGFLLPTYTYACMHVHICNGGTVQWHRISHRN
jgi:hypothetical protein